MWAEKNVNISWILRHRRTLWTSEKWGIEEEIATSTPSPGPFLSKVGGSYLHPSHFSKGEAPEGDCCNAELQTWKTQTLSTIFLTGLTPRCWKRHRHRFKTEFVSCPWKNWHGNCLRVWAHIFQVSTRSAWNMHFSGQLGNMEPIYY